MRRGYGAVAASAGFAALLLSGCVAAPVPTPPPVTVTATVTAAAHADARAARRPPPSPNPRRRPSPCRTRRRRWSSGVPPTTPGPRPGATGTPVLDGSGVPASYTVVAGDSFFDIAQRFELPQQQLLRMNPQIHDFGETVYIGDLINLDWTKTG